MKKIYLLTLILAIFASCSTTSDVVSNKRIQKRKYTKGFNIKSQNKNNHNLFNQLLLLERVKPEKLPLGHRIIFFPKKTERKRENKTV